MSIPGLKIKFIPVMKDFYKDRSQCCLEIIPEISTIQNLDQIEWKEENNLIEYTIPITYKIILKKLRRETLAEINENLNKIYYSCVDLLLPSSIARFNLASGDIKRIISDTYIVNKVSANLSNTDGTKKPLLHFNELKEKDEAANNQNSIDGHLYKKQINDSMKSKDEARNDIEINNEDVEVLGNEDTSASNTVNIKSKSIEKLTITESDFALCTDACTQSDETITCISTIMNSTSKANSNRRLSQTPVCSFDADIVKENINSNAVIYYISDFNKHTAYTANIRNIYDKNYNKYKLFTKQINMLKPAGINSTNGLNFHRRKRILPEVRVAELVQVMKKEIMPLKIMLHEILYKCAALGTVWQNPSHLSLIYKTIDLNFNDEVTQHCKKHVKSNRVVYSVVFKD